MDEINEWFENFGTMYPEKIELINLIKDNITVQGMNTSILNQTILAELSDVQTEYLDSMTIEAENED